MMARSARSRALSRASKRQHEPDAGAADVAFRATRPQPAFFLSDNISTDPIQRREQQSDVRAGHARPETSERQSHHFSRDKTCADHTLSVRSPSLPPDPQRALLVFHLAGRLAALPFENVERVAPMAGLARPPGLPSPLEGILNLAGRSVPVLRLDRLLQLPERPAGLYSTLIVVNGVSEGSIAMLVDRVSEILTVPEGAVLPIGAEDSFNACAEATVSARGETIHLLSPSRILLQKEREALSEFQAIAERRVQDWHPKAQ